MSRQRPSISRFSDFSSTLASVAAGGNRSDGGGLLTNPSPEENNRCETDHSPLPGERDGRQEVITALGTH